MGTKAQGDNIQVRQKPRGTKAQGDKTPQGQKPMEDNIQADNIPGGQNPKTPIIRVSLAVLVSEPLTIDRSGIRSHLVYW